MNVLNIEQINRQNWHWTWWCFVASAFVFPLFPAMGAVGLFVVGGKIWQLHYQQIVASRLNQSLAVLTLLAIASSFFAEHSQAAWLGLANFLPFFWLFMALKELIAKPIQLRQLSWILVLPSLPIVILGFIQIYLLWDSPPILKSIVGWEIVSGGVPPGRMSSVFIYTNFLAIYLAIAFILTFGLWLDSCQKWRSKPDSKQTQILSLLSVVLLADISGLVLTSSRNAWGLALIGFMSYALYLGWRWLIWAILGSATAVFWASFVPNFGGTQLRKIVPAFFWARLSDQIYDRPVETLRITQWQFCWNLIEQRPILGWGLRNFTPLYQAKMNYWFGHPHSLFLMLGAELGIFATLLLMGIVGTILYRAIVIFLNWQSDCFKLIYFSYLVAFFGCVLFNLSDVTIFDLRVNTIIWILLAAVAGIVEHQVDFKFGKIKD